MNEDQEVFRRVTLDDNDDDAVNDLGRIEGKKQAAADVLFQYSNFVLTCIGKQVRPCDLRLHLMKEISGMPTSLKRELPPMAAARFTSSLPDDLLK
ncbi:unnamed protein product [Camellia sinensis]